MPRPDSADPSTLLVKQTPLNVVLKQVILLFCGSYIYPVFSEFLYEDKISKQNANQGKYMQCQFCEACSIMKTKRLVEHLCFWVTVSMILFSFLLVHAKRQLLWFGRMFLGIKSKLISVTLSLTSLILEDVSSWHVLECFLSSGRQYLSRLAHTQVWVTEAISHPGLVIAARVRKVCVWGCSHSPSRCCLGYEPAQDDPHCHFFSWSGGWRYSWQVGQGWLVQMVWGCTM